MRFVSETMNFLSEPQYCYTDSSVVLAWLCKHPSNWKTFVANRVALIHELVPAAHWIHVVSGENSADCASRGLLAKEIIDHVLWWKGPKWLSDPSTV